MSVTKLSRSKSLKILLVAIVFVFSFQINMNKPKAFVPLAGYIVPIVGGLIVGEMAEMGIKWGTKAVVKKQADNFASAANAEQLANNLMFARTNPYRNKDGSLVISPTANDYAKLGGIIAGSFAGMLLEGDSNGDGIPDSCPSTVPSGATKLIWHSVLWNDTPNPNHMEGYKLSRYVNAYYMPETDGTYTFYFKSTFTDQVLTSVNIKDPNFTVANIKLLAAWNSNYSALSPWLEYGNNYSTTLGTAQIYRSMISPTYSQSIAVAESAGAELYPCNDMVVPSTIGKVYIPPLGMDEDFKMPNHEQLANRPIIINNVFPPGEEGSVPWEEIAELYPDPKDFADVVDKSIDYEKGDANKEYTTEIINNYYTDIQYPIKKDDVEYPIKELPDPLPPVVTDPVEDVDDLDHSIWEVLRNTYNYLDDGIDSSLAAMKGITDSAKGITDYLASAMGWLPVEWRAVFTSAFVLGVFAHFLRR